jgi:DNA-binding response OmpR family regulator
MHAVALAGQLRPNIIMLTAFGGGETRAAASGVGIALFLEKGDNLDDLAERIRCVHQRASSH